MSTSNVEATLQAAGKQAAVTPPEKVSPRAPLGPSLVLFMLIIEWVAMFDIA
jgi:hypothetical protein